MTQESKLTTSERHVRNITLLATSIIHDRRLEQADMRVELPKERAALENITLPEAEEYMVSALDVYQVLNTYLAQAASAHSWFMSQLEVRKKLLLGDSELQKEAKNEAQRERNMVLDHDYQDFTNFVRISRTLVDYLNPLLDGARETLQVAKKLRETAAERTFRRAG